MSAFMKPNSSNDIPLAMAYVKWQEFSETYDLTRALHVGTIFPDLHKPFCGKREVKSCGR